jgi:hypothetical protein
MQYDSAEDKARFANHLVRFASSGFVLSLFPDWFYKRLSMCFGHIAHYDRAGFYSTWFQDDAARMRWTENAVEYHAYGDPHYTYCDVERAVQAWLVEANLIRKYQESVERQIETAERAELARLKAKYERA